MNLRLFSLGLSAIWLFCGPALGQQILPKADEQPPAAKEELDKLKHDLQASDLSVWSATGYSDLEDFCPTCQTLPKTELASLKKMLEAKYGGAQLLPPADPCLLPAWLGEKNLQLHQMVLSLHKVLNLSPVSYETNQIQECDRKLFVYRLDSLKALTALLKDPR